MSDYRDGWMQTWSGKRFHPFAPRPEDVAIEDIAHSLAHLCRFGGHTRAHYSVAQHSVLVADLVRRDGGLLTDQLHALLHDAHEAYLGDVVSLIGRHLTVWCGDGSMHWSTAKIHVQRAIQVALLGGQGLPAAAVPLIERADLVALATERRDLLRHRTDAWECLRGIAPDRRKVHPLAARDARAAFLARFGALRGGGL